MDQLFPIWQSLHFSLPTQFIAICATTRLQDQHCIASSLVLLKSESTAIDKHCAWPHFTLPFSDVEDNVSLFPSLGNGFMRQQMWMNQLFVFVLCHCLCLCLCLFVGHFACTNSCFLSCRSSTCATRTGGGSPTCAATTPASTRSSGSATGTTTLTAQTRQIGQTNSHPTIFHHFCHLIAFNIILFQFCFIVICCLNKCCRYYLNDLTYRTDPPPPAKEERRGRSRDLSEQDFVLDEDNIRKW